MGPHFLCIGAPRCGTTWLYWNLNRHPQIQAMPGKELSFLNGSRSLAQKADRVTRWTAAWQWSHRNDPVQLEWGLSWLRRYAEPNETLDWYLSLFDTPAGRVAGDMSPSYCRAPAAKVRQIREAVGDVRVLLLVRDPIERDWSDAQLALQFRKAAEQASDAEYIEFFSSNRCRIPSDYLRIIDTWAALFSRFKVFYFDDIAQRPLKLIREVCLFLDIDPDAPGFRVSPQAPNPTVKEIGEFARSTNIYEAQKEIARPMMAEMKARLGGYPAAWYERHFGASAPSFD